MEMVLPRIGHHTRRFASWATKSAALGAITLALMTAALTYLVTAHLNSEATVQQQQLAALQTFISTGAEVDANVTDLVDAIDGETSVAEAKRATRHAISAHAAAAQSIEPIVGRKNLEVYQSGVGILRNLVDASSDPVSALRTSQARFDVMHNRTQIVAEARKHIYS